MHKTFIVIFPQWILITNRFVFPWGYGGRVNIFRLSQTNYVHFSPKQLLSLENFSRNALLITRRRQVAWQVAIRMFLLSFFGAFRILSAEFNGSRKYSVTNKFNDFLLQLEMGINPQISKHFVCPIPLKNL